MNLKQRISFILTPILAAILLLYVKLEPGNPKVTATFCVALLMAVWWITEAVPLAVTSLLPVVLFPLLGIMDGKLVAATYFNDVIFLFMGGFLVALAMERWQLHRRIALRILCFTGVKPASILLGFMSAAFFLSMWISNTATAMMMLPIAMSIIGQLEKLIPSEGSGRLGIGLLLGIAYGASVGGMATLVGTPPNLSFIRIYHIYFPHGPEISFSKWMLFTLPLSLTVFGLIWLTLFLMYKPDRKNWTPIDRDTFHRQLKAMGGMKREERIVLIVFITLALLWIFRSDLHLGSLTIPGWAGLLPSKNFINDGTVAMLMAVLLFLIPTRKNSGGTLLDWETASRLPWHILLLFGGGFALATGFKESGLSLWFGHHLSGITSLSPFLIVLIISLVMTFLTELTSNTAITEMILPILAGIAITNRIHPLLLMIPATLSASMAFMLPVATPPNAIIFGTNRIRISQMARTGLIINLLGALLISLFMTFYGNTVFDFSSTTLLDWLTTK